MFSEKALQFQLIEAHVTLGNFQAKVPIRTVGTSFASFTAPIH
jgi:hypothetical protein